VVVLYVAGGLVVFSGLCALGERVWDIDLASFVGKAAAVVFLSVVFGGLALTVVAFATGWDPLDLKNAPGEVLGPGDVPEDCNPAISGGRC
jgi:hypothetical protein